MHDLKYIRENPEAFDAALRRRGARAASAEVMAQDTKKRAIQTELQNMLARRNEASKAIGAAKAQKDDATAAKLMAEVGRRRTRYFRSFGAVSRRVAKPAS